MLSMPLKNFSKFPEQRTRNKEQSISLFLLSLIFFVLCPLFLGPAFSATAENAMVVTQHPEATTAALEVLKKGGNAADAAIAAQLVLNVVEPQGSGLGGGGFFLYFDRFKRSVTSLDGRETAPQSATPEMFLQNGNPLPFFPDRITGGRAVGVPGTPALIQKIYEKHASGVLTLADLTKPAIKLAETGVPVSKVLAERLTEHAERLRQFPETKKIFFHENGDPLKQDEFLIQPDLAKTLRFLGENGGGAFYEDEIAAAIAAAVSDAPVAPANLTVADLKNYAVIERDPLYGNYRGFDIFASGLPSGGVLLFQTLNILERFNLAELAWDAAALHLMAEAQKMAYASRPVLGDPTFKQMETDRLLSKEFAKEKAAVIQPDKALAWHPEASPDGMQTSHISIVDRWGNLVSWTSTIEAPFGSGITVPGYGFLLNNELSDFDPVPHGADGKLKANAPEPGKRPLSSMTPLILMKNGKPYMVLGSPGGKTIVGTIVNIILNHVDFSYSCEEAAAKPRLIFRGNKIEMETELYDHPLIRLQLELWGHNIEKNEVIGNAQTICFDDARNEIVGVADTRGVGKAEGY